MQNRKPIKMDGRILGMFRKLDSEGQSNCLNFHQEILEDIQRKEAPFVVFRAMLSFVVFFQ